MFFFFFSSRRRHTRSLCDWSSDVCSSDLGAGKTTLLAILAGINPADSGRVSVSDGEVGWVPQQAALYRRLTVAENLRLFARMERVEDIEGTIERMLDQTGL